MGQRKFRFGGLICLVVSLFFLCYVYDGVTRRHRSRTTPRTPSIGAIVRTPGHQSEKDYFEMKYSQLPQHRRLMNMSLTVAESGALSLRVSSEAVESLDYKTLRLKPLTQEEEANVTYHITSAGNASSLKNILYWNKFSHFDNFNFGAGHEAFVRHGCAVSACTATEDRSLVPEDRVDAILYWLSNNGKGNKPVPSLPRYPNAKRVLSATETSDRLARPLRMYGRSFEYIISYRYDSDAKTSYGAVFTADGKADKKPTAVNFSKGKTKMAAWFVSNCHSPPSKRSRLAKQLQRHGVAVDIYGKCGSLQCPKRERKGCFNMLEKTYKFYFSFENSLCNHYVTEKFNNILLYNVVPVTYGLGHELLGVPKDAYVDVFDFPDVKSVAQYLLYLDSNDTAYNEYFRWKKKYNIAREPYHPICKLCADLNADPPLPHRKYDMHAWFSEGQCIDVNKNPRLMNFLGM